MLKRLLTLWLALCLILTASWAGAEPAPIKPGKVSLPKAASVVMNRKITLTPVLSPAGATTTYTWSSSKKSVATVGQDGVVTGVKPGKAVITVRTANKKKASCTVTVAQIPMTGFSVELLDWRGDGCYDEDEECFWEVTGHKMYPTIHDVSPADANRAVTWKSGNSKVASVSSKGVITCKKQGAAMITATSKYGRTSVRLPVVVINNATYWTADDAFGDLYEYDEDYYYTSAKSIYAKNGHLYVDMYFLNLCGFTIKRLSKQTVYLTLDYSDTEDYDDYYRVGTYKAALKKKIPPFGIGLATFKLGKINAAKIWLTDADAYCDGYCYSKDAGAEPKAAIPGISSASRPARSEKTARGFKRKAVFPLRRGA